MRPRPEATDCISRVCADAPAPGASRPCPEFDSSDWNVAWLSHKPRPLYELHNARVCRPRGSASGGKSESAATEMVPQEIVPL
jgi:hypothetical protein